MAENKDVKDVTEEVIKSDNEKGNPYHKGKGSPDGGQFTSKDSTGQSGSESGKALPSFLKKKGDVDAAGKEQLPSFLKSKTQDGEKKKSRLDIIRNRVQAPSLKNFLKYRQKRLEEMRKKNAFNSRVSRNTEMLVNEKITELAKTSRLCANVELKKLDSVLRSGLKNQFEIQASRGMYRPTSRMNASNLLFGTDKIQVFEDGDEKHMGWFDSGKGKINPETFSFEKYGNLEAADLKTAIQNTSCSQYGETKVFFKDHVRDRATFTLNDSLNEKDECQPGYLNSPADIGVWGGSYMRDDKWDKLKNCKTLHEAANVMGSSACYDEAQIHGTLKPEDVAYVSFLYESDMSTYSGVRAIKTAASMGIPVLFCDSEGQVRRVTNGSELIDFNPQIESEPYEEQK